MIRLEPFVGNLKDANLGIVAGNDHSPRVEWVQLKVDDSSATDERRDKRWEAALLRDWVDPETPSGAGEREEKVEVISPNELRCVRSKIAVSKVARGQTWSIWVSAPMDAERPCTS